MVPVGNNNQLGPSAFCGTGIGLGPRPDCLPPDMFSDDRFVGVPRASNKLSGDVPVGLKMPSDTMLASYHPCTSDGTCQDQWDRHQQGMNEVTAAAGAEVGSRIGSVAGPVGSFAGGIIGGLIGGAIGLFN